MMSRRSIKVKEKNSSLSKSEEIAEAEVTSEFPVPNGNRKRRGKTSPTRKDAPEDDVITDFSGEPRSKKIKSIPFQDAEWSTLFENYIRDKSREELMRLVADIFMHFGDGMIEEATVLKIIDYISVRYHENFYHSFMHASHVVINVSHYLLNIQAKHAHLFSTVDKIAVIFSALIHDVDHFGVTNAELILKKHKYALLYHNQSVAEMRSLAIGLELLEKKGYELLKHWTEADQTRFRHTVIDLVLCTDIADVWKKKMTYVRFQESFMPVSSSSSTSKSNHSEQSRSSVFNIGDASCRVAFLMVAMRSADVGSSMQCSTTSRTWAQKFFDETTYASVNGRGPPVNLETYCVNQIGYMEGHSKALIERLISADILNPSFTDTLLNNIVRNIEDWKAQGENLFFHWRNTFAELIGNAEKKISSSNHRRKKEKEEEETESGDGNDDQVNDKIRKGRSANRAMTTKKK